jgi:hypothetical protein
MGEGERDADIRRQPESRGKDEVILLDAQQASPSSVCQNTIVSACDMDDVDSIERPGIEGA